MIEKTITAYKRIEEIQNAGGKIIIRGAGEYGQHLLHDLKKLNIQVSCFIDQNVTESVCGLDVYRPQLIDGLKSGTFFCCIALGSSAAYISVRNELEKNGFQECVDFADFGVWADYRMYRHFMEIPVVYDDLQQREYLYALKMHQETFPTSKSIQTNMKTIIGLLNFIATTRCSLRCKHCMEMIPYAKTPTHFDAHEIVSDLDKLLSVSYIERVAIIGGEPFLHPQLGLLFDLLSKMRNINNVGDFWIVSNGTLLPSEEILTRYKQLALVTVHLSKYDKSRYLEDIVCLCKKLNIPVYISNEDNAPWRDRGDISQKRNRTEAELKHLYITCGSSFCKNLYNGRLYPCSLSLANEDGYVPFDASAFVDIRNTGNDLLETKVNDFIYKKDILSLCDYCDGYYYGAKVVARGE